ncbi:LOW QUALITY PROTEIN: hypothetical protein RJ641_014725 [Dillenia turbinata]|uniref:Sulfotransferase n=1 Tax=Dillenia turbinata TaxID=194707 RepID=A0AAN8Z1L6_9MAGN
MILGPKSGIKLMKGPIQIVSQKGVPILPWAKYVGFFSSQEYFVAQPTDIVILISSAPKCDTTWLKALTFAIVTCSQFNGSNSPLLPTLSNSCMPFNLQALDAQHFCFCLLISLLIPCQNQFYLLIVYICRELKDVFVSISYFIRNHTRKDKVSLELEENFESISKFEVNRLGKHALCGSCKMVDNHVLYRKVEIGLLDHIWKDLFKLLATALNAIALPSFKASATLIIPKLIISICFSRQKIKKNMRFSQNKE